MMFGALAVAIISGCLWLILWKRNDPVGEYRQELLRRVGRLAREDEEAGRPWRWRFEGYLSVSYTRMLFTFWRPVNDEFYKDRSFMEPTKVDQ